MKKIIYLLVGVLLIIMPLNVLADMGAPVIKEYKASISNPNGASIYKSEYKEDKQILTKVGVLEFEKEIEITYEEKINDKEYVSYFDNGWYYVQAADVLAIEDEYNIEQATKINKKATILAENGVKMHTGPAAGYKVVGSTIPKNEEIELSYEYSSEGLYYYTEYKGQEGWISIGNGAVGMESENTKFIVVEDIPIDKTDIIIPANTLLKPKYKLDAWTSNKNSYIEYEGYEGLISDENLCYFGYDFYYRIKQPVKMYTKASKDSKVIDKEIRINDLIKSNCSTARYGEGGWMYITYDNQNGWVYYPEYEEATKYFQDVDEEELSEEEKAKLNHEEEVYEPKKEKKEEDADEEEIIVDSKKDKNQNMIYICTFGAIILALTAFVTIILVNKKKDKNKEITSKEDNE